MSTSDVRKALPLPSRIRMVLITDPKGLLKEYIMLEFNGTQYDSLLAAEASYDAWKAIAGNRDVITSLNNGFYGIAIDPVLMDFPV